MIVSWHKWNSRFRSDTNYLGFRNKAAFVPTEMFMSCPSGNIESIAETTLCCHLNTMRHIIVYNPVFNFVSLHCLHWKTINCVIVVYSMVAVSSFACGCPTRGSSVGGLPLTFLSMDAVAPMHFKDVNDSGKISSNSKFPWRNRWEWRFTCWRENTNFLQFFSNPTERQLRREVATENSFWLISQSHYALPIIAALLHVIDMNTADASRDILNISHGDQCNISPLGICSL